MEEKGGKNLGKEFSKQLKLRILPFNEPRGSVRGKNYSVTELERQEFLQELEKRFQNFTKHYSSTPPARPRIFLHFSTKF